MDSINALIVIALIITSMTLVSGSIQLYVYAQNATATPQPPVIVVQPPAAQPPTAQDEEEDFATSLTALITAIASVVGSIAGIVLAMLARVGTFKNKDAVTEVAKTALTFAQKTVDQQDQIKKAIDVGYKLSPQETQRILDAQNLSLDKLKNEVEAAHAQINRLKPMVVLKAGADSDPDRDANLPR
jgi:hypothetical protein